MRNQWYGCRGSGCRRLWILLVAMCLARSAAPARGVIIDTITGTGNTSAPADDPGWANVGVRGAGSGVYLGDRWVLSAHHVGAGSILLGGTTYAVEANTAFRLTNGGAAGTSASTDLVMFRLATDPGLPMLPIAPNGTVDAAGYLWAGSTLSQTGTDAWPPSASVTR